MAVIKVKPWGEGQGDFVFIEEENYDPDFHTMFETVVETDAVAPEKPKRIRRTRAQIEADNTLEAGD